MRGWFIVVSLLLVAGCQSTPSTPPSRELAYCEEMFAIFERYLMPMDWEGNERRDPQADLAVDLCRRNRLNEGIPILEGKLRRARWPLPQR
jgi:hypothetical protein